MIFFKNDSDFVAKHRFFKNTNMPDIAKWIINQAKMVFSTAVLYANSNVNTREK